MCGGEGNVPPLIWIASDQIKIWATRVAGFEVATSGRFWVAAGAFAVGRKNWLFSNSVAGAKASAAIYSIMVSAKLNGHNEYAYLRYVLEKLPYAEKVEDFEALLPHVLSPKDIPAPSISQSSPPDN